MPAAGIGVTGQELVSTEAVEENWETMPAGPRTPGEGLAHEAVAGPDVDDARLSVCGEIAVLFP